MKKLSKRSRIIMLAVLALLLIGTGVTGLVISRSSGSISSAGNQAASQPATINSKADLEAADSALGKDDTELDSSMSSDELNADLNSLL